MAASNLVQSLSRGLQVLEQVAQAEDGATLQDICTRLGLKAPTAHNLLRTLAAQGYVERMEQPVRYRLGARLFDLVAQHEQRSFLQRAEAVLEWAFAQLEQRVQVVLVESVGGDVVVTRRLSPEQPRVLQRPLSHALVPYRSASSLLFQAYWPSPRREAYRQRYPFEEYGQPQWRTLADLDAYLEQVRQLGYALAPSPQGARYAIAAPVFTHRHELVAALGGSSASIDDQIPGPRILACIVEQAQALSARPAAGNASPEEERSASAALSRHAH